MHRSALQRVQSALVANAPATVDMTLAQACRHVLGQSQAAGPWDKSVLDGYPGEPGFSRRTRALIIVGATVASWGMIAAIVMSAGLAPTF